ncbi:MAG TPA: hypothetical protein VFL90_15345 [Methylomirabilota bacterium]|nr:hypothetical protein [Methylomirabilota bacterium]
MIVSITRAALAAVVVLALVHVAHAELKPEDVKACNDEAKAMVQKGAASPATPEPTAKDERRAAESRGGGVSASPSEDPQVEGIDREGAKSPLYQAAYRSCMRRNGY